MARILITGAAGFMGSHLFDYLSKDNKVIGMDNYSLGTYEHERIMNIDLVDDKEEVSEIIHDFKPEIVYHLAAWAHEGLSQFMPSLITENNYNAYLNVLIPAIRAGMNRMVCFSSMSVYGDGEPPFHEDDERKPVDIYAVAKTAMEVSTEILADVFDFDYTIIRPHNVYGERQRIDDPYRNVAGIFMNRVMHNKPPIIYGDGKQTRAFTYIDDITPYVAKAGFMEDTKGEIINIGPKEEYSVNHLAKVILKAFESNLKPVYELDRPKEVKHAFCTNDKAIRLLGYQTSVTLEEGIKNMADYAKNVGPKEFKYLDNLELTNERTPNTWKKKLM